jgi:hypothetical protein
MPSAGASGRRTSWRPRPRRRLPGISAFSAISATGFVDRRQGTGHDLARRPARKTGNSFAPLQGPGKGFPTFPTFPPVIWPPTERVVRAADDARAAALDAPILMKVMPILVDEGRPTYATTLLRTVKWPRQKRQKIILAHRRRLPASHQHTTGGGVVTSPMMIMTPPSPYDGDTSPASLGRNDSAIRLRPNAPGSEACDALARPRAPRPCPRSSPAP